MNIECIWHSSRILNCVVRNIEGNYSWNLISCHCTPYEGEKRLFWTTMETFVDDVRGAWMIIWDLNEVLEDQEKLGGRPVWKKQLFLKSFCMDSSGIDLGYTRNEFTWCNGQSGLACIKERIDIAIADQEWIVQFPKAAVEHFLAECSDHSLITLRMDGAELFNYRPFRFIKAWASDNLSFNVVQKALDEGWKDGIESHQLRMSLSNTSKALKNGRESILAMLLPKSNC